MTRQACCIESCISKTTRITGLTYHRFPKNPEITKQWQFAITRTGNKAAKQTYVCSLHFDKGCVSKVGKKTVLYNNAVPAIFSVKGQLQRMHDFGKITDCSMLSLKMPNYQVKDENEDTSMSTNEISHTNPDDNTSVQMNAVSSTNATVLQSACLSVTDQLQLIENATHQMINQLKPNRSAERMQTVLRMVKEANNLIIQIQHESEAVTTSANNESQTATNAKNQHSNNISPDVHHMLQVGAVYELSASSNQQQDEAVQHQIFPAKSHSIAHTTIHSPSPLSRKIYNEHSYDLRSLNQKLLLITKAHQTKQRRLKTSQQKIRRLQRRINSLNEVIKMLNSKQLLSQKASKCSKCS